MDTLTPENINTELDKLIQECDKIALPTICKRIQNPQGLLFVKNRIIRMVTRDQLSVGAALGQLEAELNESV
jgi:hypothetical protein